MQTKTPKATSPIKLENEGDSKNHPPTPKEIFYEIIGDMIYSLREDDDTHGLFLTLDLEDRIPRVVDPEEAPSNTHCIYLRLVATDEQVQEAADLCLAWAESLSKVEGNADVATKEAPSENEEGADNESGVETEESESNTDSDRRTSDDPTADNSSDITTTEGDEEDSPSSDVPDESIDTDDNK